MNGSDLLTALRMMAESEDPFAQQLVRKGSGGMMTAPNQLYPAIQNFLNFWQTQRNIDTTPPMQKYYNSAQYQLDKARGYRY